MLRPQTQPRLSKYPEACSTGDRGQRTVTSTAGLAFGGLHPVVALYATFINRAFDQVLMDVALHRAGVTFVLDRAGVTGPRRTEPSRIWDPRSCRSFPHIRHLKRSRDATRLREELGEAIAVADAPHRGAVLQRGVGTEIAAVRAARRC
jgi:1-deoxy-D-xylulose-5-phosphate synthase